MAVNSISEFNLNCLLIGSNNFFQSTYPDATDSPAPANIETSPNFILLVISSKYDTFFSIIESK